MTYKNYLDKCKDRNAHFEFDSEGSCLLDFTERSYANVNVVEIYDEFIVLYDQVDKSHMIVPYSRLLVRF